MINIRLSGAMCGRIWMPAVQCGVPVNVNLTQERDRFTSRATIRETLLHVLNEQGGDFQNPQFTADTVIIFEYRRHVSAGRYVYASRTFNVCDCPTIADLADTDSYTSDFMDAA